MASGTSRTAAVERHRAAGEQRRAPTATGTQAAAGSGSNGPVKAPGILDRTGEALATAIGRVRDTTRHVQDVADRTIGSQPEADEGVGEVRGELGGRARENEGLTHVLHHALMELESQVARLGEL